MACDLDCFENDKRQFFCKFGASGRYKWHFLPLGPSNPSVQDFLPDQLSIFARQIRHL